MVRKSAASPSENSYYKQNNNDDDVASILTSDFSAIAKVAAANTGTVSSSNASAVNTSATNEQEEYDAFIDRLDDKQKNAIKVLDTWFQLKSSCANQMTEMEAGNEALRDAVGRSKSARTGGLASNLSLKELGMKLGIGAASISYTGGNNKASEALRKKIASLEAELVEVRTELGRERSKNKQMKNESSTALKSLKSKLKYYKKENEALTQKLVLYKEALEETKNHDATVVAASDSPQKEIVAASNTETKEATQNDKAQGGTSPIRYDRNKLRKKMNSFLSPTKASGQGNEQKLDKSADIVVPVEVVETEASNDNGETWTASFEEEMRNDTENAGDDDADLTFSDLLALNHPSATQAPKLMPKFKINSSGAFSSAPAIVAPKTEDDKTGTNVEEIFAPSPVEVATDGQEAEVDRTDEPKQSAFAMAMKNFSNGSSKHSGGFKKNSAHVAPPSVPSLDDTKAPKEEETDTVAPAAVTEAVTEPVKEESEKSNVSEEPPTFSSPAKSKIESLAETYGSSVRARRMSFDRPTTTAPVPFRKELAPIAPVKEAISADVATVETETAEIEDDTAEISTPSKESAPAAASSSIGPGSAQKELEALRSMLKGRGGMANKKRFEMFEKKAE